MENALKRRDWLLLFVGLPGGPYPTDQIRVMKGMFLFSKESPVATGIYNFEPYAYGPFDTQIYRDLDWLEVFGFVGTDYALNTNRRIYRLTKKGEELFTGLESRMPSSFALDKLRRIKLRVSSLSFLDLLKYVYERYPAYAVNSIARS